MKTFKLWLEKTDNLPKSINALEILKSVELNDHKLKLYKSAKGNNHKLLELKYKEAKENGLLDDILKNGILHPIEIKIDRNNKQYLIKGHHRLAIALKHFPKRLIKIKYNQD